MKKISVIIPVYNEEEIILNCLKQFEGIDNVELIVVDGSKERNTIAKIADSNVIKLNCHKGRAKQLNYGASIASAEILLFLHCDTFLSVEAIESLKSLTLSDKFVAGAFSLGFQNSNLAMDFIAFWANLRTHILRMPFGDQAIFVNKDYFSLINGFEDIPLLEDLDLLKRIKKARKKILIMPFKVKTSARRWIKNGVIKNTLINLYIQLLYIFGVSPYKLVKLYEVK